MKWQKFIFAIVLNMGLSTCHTPEHLPANVPDQVKSAMTSAGLNSNALTKAIFHYSRSPEDSLKLKALYFLMANMPQWHYYEGKTLDDYITYLTNIRSTQPETQKLPEDILDSLFGHFSYKKLSIKYDIQEITADQLIDNIDLAFWQWQSRPWGNKYSFSEFCEYILPFKMGDGQPEYNRDAILDHYKGLLESTNMRDLDAVEACRLVNSRLLEAPWHILLGTGILPHLPASKLIAYRLGSCRDQADLGAYVMRSLGIPISIDFVPQWPTRSLGHDFTSVIDSTGKPIMFSAADENPGLCRFMTVPKGKVYRRTVEINYCSLAMNKTDLEVVPTFMNDPYIKDVTDEYAECADIAVPLWRNEWSKQCKHAYICLFNNKSWIPVDWGNIKNDTAQFFKLEKNILYMAGYYDYNGVTPANYPFILTTEGNLRFLIPDKSYLIKADTFRKIFPILPHFLIQLPGGFQAANQASFRDLTDLYVPWTDYKLEGFWNTKAINVKDSFRYVRYFTPGQCMIGDMEFYSQGKKLTGNIISSGADMGEGDHFLKERAFDGDSGTSFISLSADSAWVGLDFGKLVHIDSIRYSPGISVFGPRCYIVSGNRYEFQFWDKEKWITIDTITAENGQVVFSNIPANGLYHIRDLSAIVKDRCFTISAGKQIWW